MTDPRSRETELDVARGIVLARLDELKAARNLQLQNGNRREAAHLNIQVGEAAEILGRLDQLAREIRR